MKSLRHTALSASFLAMIAAASAQTAGTKQSPRLQLVPQSVDTRTTFIQESPDGTRLLSHDQTLAPRLWDPSNLRLLATLGGNQASVSEAMFSPDGKRILTRNAQELQLWDAAQARLVWTHKIKDAQEEFTSMAFSANSSKIVVTTRFGDVRVLNVAQPLQVTEFKVPPSPKNFISDSAFIGDSKVIVSGDFPGAYIWDLSTGKALPKIDTVAYSFGQIVVSRDQSTALVVGGKDELTVIDGATGTVRFKSTHVMAGSLTYPVFAGPKQDEIIAMRANGLLVGLNAKTGQQTRELKGHREEVYELKSAPDGTVISGGYGERTLIWAPGSTSPREIRYRDEWAHSYNFSGDSKTLWAGMYDGTIKKFDLRSLKLQQQQKAQTVQPTGIRFVDGSRLSLWNEQTYSEPRIGSLNETKFIRLTERGFQRDDFPMWLMQPCDLGRYGLVADTVEEGSDRTLAVMDFWQGRVMWKVPNPVFIRAMWVPNSTQIIAERRNGWEWYDAATAQNLGSWNTKTDGGRVYPGPLPNTVAIIGIGGVGMIFDMVNQKMLATFEPQKGPNGAWRQYTTVGFTPDGSKMVTAGEDMVTITDAVTGKHLKTIDYPKVFDTSTFVTFSPDSSKAYVGSGGLIKVVDLKALERVVEIPNGYSVPDDYDQIFDAERARVITVFQNLIQIRNTRNGEVISEMKLSEMPHGICFSPDGQRVLVLSTTEHLTIWDPKPEPGTKKARQMGTVIQALDGTLMVMDTQGRYDAVDPSNVDSAIYTMTWEKGIETLDVGQFKSTYWDPGLFNKIMGLWKDKTRDVPDLTSVRLFPAIAMNRDAKGRVDVELTERDSGGIGRVQVFVNNRMVEEKTGAGYFTFDPEKFRSAMLPESLLPAGQGNLLGIRVSNAKGDLTSDIKTFDLGIPAGLKAPEVKLYALFCGISDYVGTDNDLGAPASDAIALEQAIRTTSGNLLGQRVSTTVMTTLTDSPALRPTRANIMKWFEDTAAKATSSDIVMVFFAGHGIDRLGSKSGYFYLTSESNPSQLVEGSLASQSVSGEDLKLMLSKIAATKQIVLLDTCHSGAAAGDLISASRSVSGDYARAFESIKDANGTWMLAGSAADQRSYESVNVDHGMLTYSLLEAIDRGTGLRQAPSGELFLDVEKWLSYGAARVESLKDEVGIGGLQKPEFKRSATAQSFDIGVMDASKRGFLNLKPPMPIVIIGAFEQDEEDPAGLEDPLRTSFRALGKVKPWFDVAKHPNVYRVTGNYTLTGDKIEVKVFLQRFDATGQRKTVETFTVNGSNSKKSDLSAAISREVEARILKLEAPKTES